MEVTESADDAVASLGEIVKSFHDGGAELTPVGGIVIIGAGRGRWALVAGIVLSALAGGFAGSGIEKRSHSRFQASMRLSRVKGGKVIKLLKTFRK
jgi:outer membrane lipoprotein SlyB